jgi:Sec-independent protein translocase protein TatA
MFNISWSELLIIIVVCIMVLRPKDMPIIISTIKTLYTKFSIIKSEIIKTIKEIEKNEHIKDISDEVFKTKSQIIDLNGNLQQVFDLKEIMPDIVEEEKNKKHEQ